MSEFVSVILVVLGLAVAFVYVGAPFVVLATFRMRVPTNIVFFDEQALTLPQHVRDYFDPAREALEAEGFQPVSYFCLPDLVNNAKSICTLLCNFENSDCAMINCMYSEMFGAHSLQTAYVEFVTRFRDGVSVQTKNSHQIGAFAEPPDDHTIQFWNEKDVNEVYRRHLRICERLSSDRRRFPFQEDFQGDVEQFLQAEVLQQPLEYQVSQGLFYRVPDGYRPTLKGAFLLTWQELWPWKSIRRQRRKREAARWLAEIGFADH